MSGLQPRIPPILGVPGLHFEGIVVVGRSTMFVFSAADGQLAGDGLIQVVVSTLGTPLFRYSRYDHGTKTIRNYKGPHGDPEKDGYDIASV